MTTTLVLLQTLKSEAALIFSENNTKIAVKDLWSRAGLRNDLRKISDISAVDTFRFYEPYSDK